jgi:hypothetical protein
MVTGLGRGVILALLVAAAALAGACRGIAGIRSITYEASEAGDATADAEGDAGDDAPPETSTDGACPTVSTTLVSTPDYLDEVSLDDAGFIYFDLPLVAPTGPMTNGGVVRCPTGGCKSLQNVYAASANSSWADYDLSPAKVYYALLGAYVTGGAPDGGDMIQPGELGTVGLDGTNPQTFAVATYPDWVAVVGSDLFWFNDPGSGGDPNADSGTWLQCPLAGCPPDDAGMPGTPWVTGISSVFQVLSDSKNLYFVAEAASSGGGLANLYACSRSTPCGDVDGPNVRTLVLGIDDTGTTSTFDFTNDDTAIYGTYLQIQGSIVKVDSATGSTTTLATKQSGPMAFAVDGPYLYWAAGASNIYRTLTSGKGPLETVTCGQPNVDNITIDAQYIYFTAQGSGQSVDVRRIPKPQ